MNLKGTESEKNLRAALMGESLARNKYTFYAMQATKEGHADLAELFERMAKNETTHAKIWFNLLHGEAGETRANLVEAAGGEHGEWREMYPSFAETARREGLDELADMFEKVANIEKSHEETFLREVIALDKKATNPGAAAEKSAPEQPKTMINAYRCQFCGAIFDTRPDVCSVCHAIGAFDSIQVEK